MYTQGKYIYPMKINPNDLIGKKVGRLKVISYAGYKDDYSLKIKRTLLRKRHFYLCQCECGNFVVVRRCVLQAGTTLSCGCLRREKLEQTRARRSSKSVSWLILIKPHAFIGVKISYLQRRIIIHSLLYYELNVNCISDESFDELCIQLLEMQKSADIKELEQSTYYYVFYDFDGSTGCDIPQRLTDYDYKYLLNIAQHVYKLYEQDVQNKNKKGEN